MNIKGNGVHKPLVGAVAVFALLTGTLVTTGCGVVTNSQPCLPPAFTVTPSTARPGDRVKVEAKDATCNPRYGKDAQIQVTFTEAAGTPGEVQLGPMNDAGGFSFDLKVPPGAAVGKGSVEAYPYNIDWCDDTGQNNRVGFGSAESAIERVSCAQILVPLTIIK